MFASLFAVNDILLSFVNSTKLTNGERCSKKDHFPQFFLITCLPSLLATLVFSLLAKKNKTEREVQKLKQKVGIIYPMDLFTRINKASYCCVFCAATATLYDLASYKRFFANDGFIHEASMLSFNILIYSSLFFNITAAMAIQTALAYAIGALFVWSLTGMKVYEIVVCVTSSDFRMTFALKKLPVLLALIYMSLKYPLECVKALRSGQYTSLKNIHMFYTVDQIRKSYQGQHVRKLLKHPVQRIVNAKYSNVENAIQVFLKSIYHDEMGFKYPSILIVVLFVSALLIYTITLDLMAWLVPILSTVLKSCVSMLENMGYNVVEGEHPNVTTTRENIRLVFNLTQCVFYSVMVAIPMACIILVASMLHSLVSFRTHVFAIYRGEFKNLPSAEISSGAKLCLNSLKFSGYQVAYIVTGHLWTCLFLFLSFFIITSGITLLASVNVSWYYSVSTVGTFVLIAIISHAIQALCVQLFFLQGDGRYLRLDNRRFFFVFAYIFFFYNIVSGFVSCVMRIIMSILVSFFAMSKMDICLLPRKLEVYDPGFIVYHGYVHLESAHNNPVLLVFIDLLISLSKTRQLEQRSLQESNLTVGNVDRYFVKREDVRKPIQKVGAVYSGARFTWLVAFTLIQNPTIRIYRRGFIQLLNAAIKCGLKVPLSDRPIYFILTQLQSVHKRKKKTTTTTKSKAAIKSRVKKKRKRITTQTASLRSQDLGASTEVTAYTSTEASES